MFEDDGITFRHEVERVKKKRKAWKKRESLVLRLVSEGKDTLKQW